MKLTSHFKSEDFRKGQKEMSVLLTSENPPHWNTFWLSHMCTTRKDPESERLARDTPETNITIKPEASSHIRAVLLGSLALLLSPGAPSQ